jgi:two-component system sensor histidine kinase MprB
VTIRRRIALVSAAAVAVTVVVVSILAFVGASRQIMDGIDDSLYSRAQIIESVPVGVIPPGFADFSPGRDDSVRPGRGDFDSTFYQVILRDGTTINAGVEGVVLPAPAPDEVNVTEPTLRTVRVDDLSLRVVTVYHAETGAIVQLARPLTEARATLAGFAVILAVGGVLGVAVAGGLGLLVARSALKPIDELRGSISDIAMTGTLTDRLEVNGTDEIADLAVAFNELLAEIESSKAEQVRLVRDAGHELRTPLTALRTNLEILQRHNVPEDERAAMIDAAHSEVAELSALVTEVVDLATDRYEEEDAMAVRLSDVVEEIAERARRRNGRDVVIEDDGSVVVAKRDAIERAINNIVANADKWSPEGEPIMVTIDSGGVTVTDSGPGFDEADVDHVFERFYRSSEARSMPGSGLGLSIVAQIVEDHGGTVFAHNRSDATGAVVGFELPEKRKPEVGNRKS